jgi:ATP-binding cassette subfamily F protein uup
MAPLVRFDAVSVTFGEQRVLIDADLAIEPGERVCLVGRNGAGKSTTLKLITGAQEPDDGAVEKPARLRWSLLEQKLADESQELVRDYVAHGMAGQLARIAEFERLTAAVPHDRAALRKSKLAAGNRRRRRLEHRRARQHRHQRSSTCRAISA